jgi:catechol 2,3-dioxygenase-like lactoylglutathione lyase family enzyme
MSSTDVTSTNGAAVPGTGTVDMKLEVVVLPVADVERSKQFYERLGWRLDAEFAAGDDFHLIQPTPPGSPTAVILGIGITSAEPGSGDGVVLVVDDVEVARADLVARGVDVSEVFHDAGGVFVHAGTTARVPGPDPERRSYGSWASFDDPDGNGWLLQEITTRLPGRVEAPDVAELAALLRETAEHHGRFEAVTPPHDWWDWYAAYLGARQQGAGSEEATTTADRYMAETKGIVAG